MAGMFDFTPSRRKGPAQRMLAATTLICEAAVIFFSVLVAHGLAPEHRAVTWTVGLALVVLLLVAVGMMRRPTAAGYWLGLVLQLPVLLMGLVVPAMWVVGAAFAILYLVSVVKGHTMDREKDAVDARVLGTDGRG
ncbi:DUF4233 domain-containing protein [Helcobacillus massiliensis]|uniref:DUF4233 domain-containing protein n=1 Tax=Helcobacillus massiliensis TaxID=521392 RepID=UPI00255230E6|nr:DUF4233 domain-containing protein [Helcobacillus massiliensis]MDK7742731.1 DUF4233 domain-containing protein [Helcobacillus massiliensis]WOO93272.1 DUF4233 domain-containing protein [Helcobacillus massiliensis]